ncbi:MAG: aconitase X catalytic domain-containing protein, partial [Thermoplasmata archaeon]|nr:aconitase X catalytic domain-containing protein [Thermoplasmata archaeon]
IYPIMHLTRYEEKMLDGEMGEGVQLAMKLLVNLGEMLDAPHLIPISSAHISGVSYKTGGKGLIETLRRFSRGGTRVAVKSTLNPCGLDLFHRVSFSADKEFVKRQMEIVELYEKMGVRTTLSCIPYKDENVPSFGVHISWAESNAVVYANSVLGARTNKEGSISALASAIVGATPYYGMHLLKNRLPKVEVRVDGEVSIWESQVLGAVVGERVGSAVVMFDFKPSFPKERLNRMGAALTAYGDAAMFHLRGITEESRRYGKRIEKEIEERIEVERRELREFTEKVSGDLEEASIFVVGCPHLSVDEMKEVAEEVKGKRVRRGKRFLLFTNRYHLKEAEKNGILKVLKDSSIEVYTDTCMVVSTLPDDAGIYVTDSLKAYFYLPKLSKKEAKAAPLMSIISSALE